jgi:hypothetical protein
MERRNFLKTGVLATSGAFFIDTFSACSNFAEKNKTLDEYYESFGHPPVTSQVFVRWWWNGNRLDKNEILRELDVMKAAGIGGVEINPIAFPQNSDPAGYEELTIFEDKWLEMLKTALHGAKERGIICDMIVGSGWPFGGEFLKKQDQTQMVTIETLDLTGEKEYVFSLKELLDKVKPNIHSKNKTVYKDLLMVRLVPATSDEFDEGVELINNFHNELLTVNVPKGQHVLYFVVKLTGYMAVINGAPGAAGPVLNHYNKKAVENYLNRISDLITGKIGNMGNHIRAMFCDSLELEGANWNDDLPDEFEKRRGYSLWPYLPFVLKKVGHMGNPLSEDYGTKFSDKTIESIERVSLDLYKTRIELFKERFIDTFNGWCHKNNVLSRVQAYGRGYHPLEASMEIDIPECETWLRSNIGREYPDTGLSGRAPTMVNKYVASGAVLAGRQIVSCEEITNTSMVFMATLEHIKIAGDQSNISGVNHSILHGFNYSPPEASFPGWVRYGTWFNERNTWWPWFKLWADYKARISYMLQNAIPQANIAILQPLNDLWLKIGPQRDPFPQKWYPDYQNNLWEAIHQNGGGCDYVSEKIINNASFKEGKMIYNQRSWHTLLLPEIETLDKKTAQTLSDFVETDGRIVFIEKSPFKSPSYKNSQTNDAEVKQIIDNLLKRAKNKAIVYLAPEGDPNKWYGKLQDELEIKPYVKFSNPQKFLSQSCYKLGENWLFFIANTSLSENISVEAEFQVEKDLIPWIWDAETGEKWRYPTLESNNRVKLTLPRATSCLIVFDKERTGELFHLPELTRQGKEIAGSWKLQLNHIDGTKQQVEIESLTDLAENEQTKQFAGTVVYETTFHLDNDSFHTIDLGNVQGITELFLNGKTLGTRWYGAHVYNIEQAIKPEENKLSIRLTTIVGNYLKGQKDNPVAQIWTEKQDYYPMGIIGPVRIISG